MSTNWLDRPTLITGATGLVGGWLTRELVHRRANAVCLVRDATQHSDLSGVTIVRGDICDQPLLERILGEYEIDTVFHLAAQTVVGVANRNADSTFRSNIAGTWMLLEACRRSPLVKSIVVASSDKAYGTHADLPYTEENSLAAIHPYDVSKACADMIAQSYAATFDSPVAITRCGNFFGGGDFNWNRLVPGTIRCILRGQRPAIRSDGQFQRDYLYVEDGVAAYLLLAERLHQDDSIRGSAFNFSNGRCVSVLALVDLILQLMQSDLEPDIQYQSTHEIRDQLLSCELARQQLGWTPAFTLESGLRRTIDWYRRHLAESMPTSRVARR